MPVYLVYSVCLLSSTMAELNSYDRCSLASKTSLLSVPLQQKFAELCPEG